MKLCITSGQLQELKALGKKTYPEEACALLVGKASRVSEVVISRNIAEEPLRFFEIDPAVRIKVEKQCRVEGCEIIGVFHSHPNGEAAPSQIDAKMIYEPDLCWVIASVDQNRHTEIAAFHPSKGEGFEKAELIIEGN